jgi:hypothetical protein
MLQLQAGYMFRNAELRHGFERNHGSARLGIVQDWDAFDRLDSDGSGYIESFEVKDMLDDLYAGKTPAFEVGLPFSISLTRRIKAARFRGKNSNAAWGLLCRNRQQPRRIRNSSLGRRR